MFVDVCKILLDFRHFLSVLGIAMFIGSLVSTTPSISIYGILRFLASMLQLASPTWQWPGNPNLTLVETCWNILSSEFQTRLQGEPDHSHGYPREMEVERSSHRPCRGDHGIPPPPGFETKHVSFTVMQMAHFFRCVGRGQPRKTWRFWGFPTGRLLQMTIWLWHCQFDMERSTMLWRTVSHLYHGYAIYIYVCKSWANRLQVDTLHGYVSHNQRVHLDIPMDIPIVGKMQTVKPGYPIAIRQPPWSSSRLTTSWPDGRPYGERSRKPTGKAPEDHSQMGKPMGFS